MKQKKSKAISKNKKLQKKNPYQLTQEFEKWEKYCQKQEHWKAERVDSLVREMKEMERQQAEMEKERQRMMRRKQRGER